MTFITLFGHYCCNRIPFEITSGPEEFQRKSSELLQGLRGVHVIMDDVLLHGSIEEHDAHLEVVLNRIRDSGLKLNKDKCKLWKTQLTYFGHTVGAQGIKLQPVKVKAIQELPSPTSVTDLPSAIGMIN